MLLEGAKQESREVAGAEEKMRGDGGQTDGGGNPKVMDSWNALQLEMTVLLVRQT